MWAEAETDAAHDMVPHCRLTKFFEGTLNRLEMIVHPELRETVQGPGLAAVGKAGDRPGCGQLPHLMWPLFRVVFVCRIGKIDAKIE